MLKDGDGGKYEHMDKKVRIRKEHICEACNETIEKGKYAFRVSIMHTAYQRFPDILYFHATDISEEDFEEIWRMGYNEIRKRICKNASI